MTLEQYKGGLGVPEEYIDKFDDYQPLSLTAQDIEVLKNLHVMSHNDGFEHGAAAVDGKVYEFTSGLQGKVSIPDEVKKLINAAPNKSVHLYHSHTNATPHSATDFQWLLNEKIDRISVIAYNGDAYSVSFGSGWIPDINEFDGIADRIRSELDFDIFDFPGYERWTLDELHYARVREQAFRIAQHFKWTMEGGSLL